jgi:hypothetical protein
MGPSYAVQFQTNSPEFVNRVGDANAWAVNEETIGTIYSMQWPHGVLPYKCDEGIYQEWFSMAFREMLEQRANDGYVYGFDKKQDAAWFTATLKELVEERERNGYVYVLG